MALVVAGFGWLCWLRPLTAARVERELGPDPDLIFEFSTGPQGTVCAQAASDDPEVAARSAAALAAGWVARGSGQGHAELRLTSAGQRVVARSPYAPTTCEADARGTVTTYGVPVARFERSGSPEVETTESRTRRRVVVRGRWVPNEAGQVLARAGWRPLLAPALRDERFELHLDGWRRIPDLLGRDL